MNVGTNEKMTSEEIYRLIIDSSSRDDVGGRAYRFPSSLLSPAG